MSWDQQYAVPRVENLLEELTGLSSYALLKKELAAQGILIVKEEEVVLDSGMYEEVKGTKLTLSDGRVFIPKLIEKYTSDGNYGLDVYKYVLESETPAVEHIDADTSNPDIDVYSLSDEEYDPEYDSPIDEAME